MEEGEYLCIIGPSGCGKSTLLKCIAGIWKPDAGEIYIDGKLVNDTPMQERGIGYVFQEIALFPHKNVYENVSYGPTVKGWEVKKTKTIVEEILNMLKLEERIDAYPNELSGGAKQKTAIGRALASGSKLLLLDEPLGALDAKVREVLRLEIRNLVKDLGLTAIHVTHDQEEAMAISDRIIVMRGGEIVENASPRDLYLKPKRIFTAYFLGETNLLVGEVTEKARGKSIVRIGSNDLRVKGKVKPEAKRVVAAIRPEFISITKKPKRKCDNRWLCKVKSLTFTGNIIRYEVQTVDGIPILIKMPSTDEEIEAQIGDEVYIEFSSRDVNLYPYPEEGLEKEISLE
ncbi:spermidine/putrescine ABC transporter ATP-binding protein [Candidatus Bathyarchaeota archaeon B24-2]|nr:MAG: spermidine/putrescine ABC transporter ATP-binding protein [Candidatus Bathyarchaeota archaeon B24-2]